MDYKTIKAECEQKFNLLEAKLSSAEPVQEKIDDLLEKALYNLVHIDERYEQADIKGKRQIIGSIFREKLEFDGRIYRTANINEAVQLIYKLDKAFSQKENGQASMKTDLSKEVNLFGLESLIDLQFSSHN